MNKKYIGSCTELEQEYPTLITESCCSSCHVDNEEYGYSLQYVDIEEGYYEVCCKIKAEFTKNQTLNK